MKASKVALCLVFALAAGKALDTIQSEDYEPSPCTSFEGIEVQYDSRFALTLTGTTATAIIVRNRPGTVFMKEYEPGNYTLYDPIPFYFRSKNERRFAFAHECVHHNQTAIQKKSLPRYKLELDADCRAAKNLRKEGMSLNEVRDSMSMFKNDTESSTYVSGDTRISKALQCAKGIKPSPY